MAKCEIIEDPRIPQVNVNLARGWIRDIMNHLDKYVLGLSLHVEAEKSHEQQQITQFHDNLLLVK